MSETSLGSREAGHFFTEKEWSRFNEIVADLAGRTDAVVGVLAVGSLMQAPGIPENHFDHHDNPYGKAYELIRRPERRKPHHSPTSDLDIWVCTRDVVDDVEEAINQGGIHLLDAIVEDPSLHRTSEWITRKRAYFGPYYKQESLYPEAWHRQEPKEPWMAHNFLMSLEDQVVKHLPHLVQTVNERLVRSIPGDFLEVRAFPESTFHLRPDEHIYNGTQDRSPFPRIANQQWIDPSHNTHIFYASDDATIHPFRSRGQILGQSLEDYIIGNGTPAEQTE